MPSRIDLTGKIFGRLTVISPDAAGETLFWRCLCECGNHKSINGASLRRGATVSCGCRMRETADQTSHGKSGTKTHHIWNHIKQRCGNPNNPAYRDYGGRGIRVCQRWMESFQNFLDDMGECPPGLTIDRYPNNDGDYEPGNCRWATMKEQSNNRRHRRDFQPITFNGETKHMAAWLRDPRIAALGISARTLSGRLFNGWSVERAFTTPKQQHGEFWADVPADKRRLNVRKAVKAHIRNAKARRRKK